MFVEVGIAVYAFWVCKFEIYKNRLNFYYNIEIYLFLLYNERDKMGMAFGFSFFIKGERKISHNNLIKLF